MKMKDNNFSSRLKSLRSEHGWSQQVLAEKIGVSISTVQRWERQGGTPVLLARREINKLFEDAGLKRNELDNI